MADVERVIVELMWNGPWRWAIGRAGIEIPYSKHDLYLKEVPPGLVRDLES